MSIGSISTDDEQERIDRINELFTLETTRPTYIELVTKKQISASEFRPLCRADGQGMGRRSERRSLEKEVNYQNMRQSWTCSAKGSRLPLIFLLSPLNYFFLFPLFHPFALC